MKVQKFGFQDQEDDTRQVSEERSVRFWYVSTYNVFAENIHRKHNLRYRPRFDVD